MIQKTWHTYIIWHKCGHVERSQFPRRLPMRELKEMESCLCEKCRVKADAKAAAEVKE
jgi:hypothetical protein